MRLLSQPRGSVYVAEAPVWDRQATSLRGRDHLLIGIMPDTLAKIAQRGMSVGLGQLYGVVCPGLIHAQHLYEGLKREMQVDGDGEADKKKLAATWAQPRDAVLAGNEFSPTIEYLAAPEKAVFAVYISCNRMLQEYPDIYGWAEHWTWIHADPKVAGAPVEWDSRYDRKLWCAARPGA